MEGLEPSGSLYNMPTITRRCGSLVASIMHCLREAKHSELCRQSYFYPCYLLWVCTRLLLLLLLLVEQLLLQEEEGLELGELCLLQLLLCLLRLGRSGYSGD